MNFIRLIAVLGILHLAAAVASAMPAHLRCEFMDNPLGIDATAPRLSWQSDSTEQDWRQVAYEILVATRPELLKTGSADVWDSGKVQSAESVGIVYAGPKLQSRHRYYWSVRTWDAQSHSSEVAAPAWWEMGLLLPTDWSAKWILWTNPDTRADQQGMNWIYPPGQDPLHVAPETTEVFRLGFDLNAKPASAVLFLLGRGNFSLSVNGRQLDSKHDWHSFVRQDIGDQLLTGNNVIEITVKTPKLSGNDLSAEAKKGDPAAIAAMLKIIQADGNTIRYPTNEKWETRLGTDTNWKPSAVFADWTDKRFGDVPAALPQPAALLRRDMNISREIRSARLYVTALGSYRFLINGTRVGDDVLSPEYTDYRKRVLYQTYDVTKQMKKGENVLAATLGDGWFGSGFTWNGEHTFTGPDRLLAQLEVNYADDSTETISTDGAWRASKSAILHSEIYAGETVDARLQPSGWDRPGFTAAAQWSTAVIGDAPANTKVTASPSASRAQVVMTLKPKTVTPVSDGAFVFDMGQNMVGWAKLKVKGPAGTTIRLRFAEILNPDGSIYRENLRNADATDIYTLRGGATEEFTPYFTFHGFRYVEVRGYPGKPTLDSLEGQVVSSLRGEGSGTLSTSSDLVNRMWSIGLWGQRGNFVTVPTDCPQRDERLGWMGDAGVFWRTGTYNFDIAAFSEKWMNDVTDAQTPEGAFTNVSPNMLTFDRGVGAPGWGDAGVIVPYTTWLQYGDKRVIEDNWDAMQRWMEFIAKANPDFIRKNGVGPNFADWLAPDSGTPKDLISTAYWALVANQMVEMAQAAGKSEDAKRYQELFDKIRTAYQKAYINEVAEVAGGTQTAYVLTLNMKLASPSQEPALVDNLVKKIQARDNHLSTGFLGTPFLLFALSDHGRADIAYQLLLNETYPSWGYMLSKGATTWWERWNGDTGDPAMNSYNHYAFGSVVAWVYRKVAGVDTFPSAPGFHQIVFHPLLDDRITHARGEYDSIYGKITSDWTGTKQGPFTLKITVPANTTGQVFLPNIPNAHISQDGKSVAPKCESAACELQVGSGPHEFTVK
jgi:alpha-L-rhamnosidase